MEEQTQVSIQGSFTRHRIHHSQESRQDRIRYLNTYSTPTNLTDNIIKARSSKAWHSPRILLVLNQTRTIQLRSLGISKIVQVFQDHRASRYQRILPPNSRNSCATRYSRVQSSAIQLVQRDLTLSMAARATLITDKIRNQFLNVCFGWMVDSAISAGSTYKCPSHLSLFYASK